MRNTKNLIRLFVVSLLLLPVAPLVSAQQEVTIAAVLPITGVFGFAGGEINTAFIDAVAIANEEGGVNGKKIRYVAEDGKYTLDVAMAAFRKIISSGNPLVFFAESTTQARALAPDLKTQYKMLLGSVSFSGELADTAMNPYSFVAGPTYGDQFGILLKYIAKEKPGAKVAFFYSDTEFGKDPIKFGRLMCDRLRLKLVAEEMVPLRVTDLTAQIADLKSKDPDYVIFQGFLVDPIPQVVKACRDVGVKCTFMGTFWSASKMVLEKFGPLAEGYMVVNPFMYWWNEDVPMIKKLRDFAAKRYPDVQYRDNFYLEGYVNALIAIECMRQADKSGQLDREGVAKALQSIKDFNTEGLTGPWTIHNNRFPVARVWSANPQKGIFEPASDWIRLDRYY
jgi:branched-chain amino acid transport system substrate-binding protein